jgi:ABC-2 type transport system permease protein
MAYRLNFFLEIIGPALVFFFVKYNLWSSIYESNPGQVISGYSFSQMISYHVWTLVIGLLGRGHASWDLSTDIRMGRISSYLIYPFNFWQFHTASWIAFQLIQVVIALVTIGIITVFNIIPLPGFTVLCHGFIYTLFISLFWYAIQYGAGLISFWLEETWVIRVLLGIVTVFLSGAIVPLEMFPTWLVEVLNWTPFPYLTHYPAKIFMGQAGFEPKAYLIVSTWLVVIAYCNHKIWTRGIRLYTAAGM